MRTQEQPEEPSCCLLKRFIGGIFYWLRRALLSWTTPDAPFLAGTNRPLRNAAVVNVILVDQGCKGLRFDCSSNPTASRPLSLLYQL